MEQSRKNLKLAAIVVLVFVVVSVLQIVSELAFGDLNTATIPEGAPENVLLITKIILLAVSAILLLPQIYIGIKGLKIAKNPHAFKSAKAHIVWAMILFVFAALSLISPVVAIVKQDNVGENVRLLFSFLLDVIVYYDYIKYARAVAKAA